jgi:flagellum-specific ATP synthase
MVDVVSEAHFETSNRIKEVLVNYREAEDLINVGAYQEGNNPEIDYAIRYVNGINGFLRQGMEENTPFQEMFERMVGLLADE